jgi:hypothetical protein
MENKDDKKDKKYVVNLNFSNKGEFKKTIELNISNDPSTKRETTKRVIKRKRRNILIDGFFGWNNIKWFIREIGKIYSSDLSYFSKKRFESSIAFIIAQWGMVLYLYNNYNELTMSDFLLWAAAEFIVAGYYVNQIQREKKDIGYNNEYTYEVTEETIESDDNKDDYN